MSEIAYTQFGFSEAEDEAQVLRYADIASRVEGAFLNEPVLLALRGEAQEADLDEDDREDVLGRVAYYLWDLGRQARDEDRVPVTWGLEPEEEEPEGGAAA